MPPTRPAATRAIVVLVAAVLAAAGLLTPGAIASAHDDIASSTPSSGSTIADPISEATIDFGEVVNDVEMALIGPDDEIVDATAIVQVDPTTVRIEFAELEREGTYIVRYLAPVPADGHTLAGAIQFTFGSSGGSSNLPTILGFGAAAIVILAIGAYFSWRRHRTLRASQVDDDLADVGI